MATFPYGCVLPLRRQADRDIPANLHWRDSDRGGHFPAMEVPEHLVEDIRTLFGSPLLAAYGGGTAG